MCCICGGCQALVQTLGTFCNIQRQSAQSGPAPTARRIRRSPRIFLRVVLRYLLYEVIQLKSTQSGPAPTARRIRRSLRAPLRVMDFALCGYTD